MWSSALRSLMTMRISCSSHPVFQAFFSHDYGGKRSNDKQGLEPTLFSSLACFIQFPLETLMWWFCRFDWDKLNQLSPKNAKKRSPPNTNRPTRLTMGCDNMNNQTPNVWMGFHVTKEIPANLMELQIAVFVGVKDFKGLSVHHILKDSRRIRAGWFWYTVLSCSVSKVRSR